MQLTIGFVHIVRWTRLTDKGCLQSCY